MHFIFPGRMALVDLPYEALRVAKLLDRHGFDALYGVRLRVQPLASEAMLVLEDRLGERVEVVDVPPLELSLSAEAPINDSFELQEFATRSRFETRLTGVLRRTTGPDRGPASLERLLDGSAA